MDQGCCAETRACAADPACQEAALCLSECSDATCEARCGSFYTESDTLLALRSCRVKNCATPCSTGCGEFASAVPSCETCRENACCSLGAACAVNPECEALDRCIANCFSAQSCPTACYAAHPAGTNDYAAWHTCTDRCASVCQVGQDWMCLDSVMAWPKPKAVAGIDFSATFVSFTSETPFAGAMVKACDKFDFSCATPLVLGKTDSTGLVELMLPVGLSGFDGYLEITGGKTGATGGAIYPSIWYPEPFLIADGWQGRNTMLSVDELNALAGATGTAVDSTRGAVAVKAVDCNFDPAAHVSFSVDIADSKSLRFYIVGGAPDPSATESDQSGISAFVNLPAAPSGTLTVIKATVNGAVNRTTGRLSVIVRPGTLTVPRLFPPQP